MPGRVVTAVVHPSALASTKLARARHAFVAIGIGEMGRRALQRPLRSARGSRMMADLRR
jgi:hypothetical protein